MNNVGSAFIMNIFFSISFFYWLKTQDAWNSFGINAFGLLVLYFWNDEIINRLVK